MQGDDSQVRGFADNERIGGNAFVDELQGTDAALKFADDVGQDEITAQAVT